MNMNDDKDMPEPLLAAHFDALRTELAGRDAPRCVEKGAGALFGAPHAACQASGT